MISLLLLSFFSLQCTNSPSEGEGRMATGTGGKSEQIKFPLPKERESQPQARKDQKRGGGAELQTRRHPKGAGKKFCWPVSLPDCNPSSLLALSSRQSVPADPECENQSHIAVVMMINDPTSCRVSNFNPPSLTIPSQVPSHPQV